eukprot:TRINITY_DN17738_c0_g1_i1.p1 TRINITY_DN17738_c0_g1~~TRINITY_DN17738_c0_g1_i1.p1  ORF type:complete len:299 (+),score=64.81 TRINITY_DN17738_c0_g1_i1:76-897(+)
MDPLVEYVDAEEYAQWEECLRRTEEEYENNKKRKLNSTPVPPRLSSSSSASLPPSVRAPIATSTITSLPRAPPSFTPLSAPSSSTSASSTLLAAGTPSSTPAPARRNTPSTSSSSSSSQHTVRTYSDKWVNVKPRRLSGTLRRRVEEVALVVWREVGHEFVVNIDSWYHSVALSYKPSPAGMVQELGIKLLEGGEGDPLGGQPMQYYIDVVRKRVKICGGSPSYAPIPPSCSQTLDDLTKWAQGDITRRNEDGDDGDDNHIDLYDMMYYDGWM